MRDKLKRVGKHVAILFGLLFLANCAGWDRGCSSCVAEDWGADWIVVQYNMGGEPINCWKLNGVAITNEQSSDGIYWKDSHDHLVHISGWYNRVQVSRGDFNSAAKSVGIDLARCDNGAYQVKE